jgi:polyphenol oxidase
VSGEALSAQLPGGGQVRFTTRAEGNLSMSAGAGHEHGLQRRDELCERLGLRWLCASPQVHGTDVQRILELGGSAGQPAAAPADGHATAIPCVGAMTLGADCLPVAISAGGAVAMIHAGWRGLAAGVLEEGLLAVRELGGEGPAAAVIGPCAGVCCYEVGPEVHAALGATDSRRGRIDLRAIARRRLLAAGASAVEDVEACTICDERFFSYRREGAEAGRQAGVAWLS